MPESFPLLLLAIFVLLQATAMVYDLWTLTIPNPITYGIACLFLFGAAADPTAVAWLEHLAAGALLLLVGIALFAGGIIGGGDVKLLSATALWFGLADLPALLLLVGLVGIALAVVLVAVRRLVPAWVERLPASAARCVPRAFLPEQGVPYGLAIAGSAIGLALGAV